VAGWGGGWHNIHGFMAVEAKLFRHEKPFCFVFGCLENVGFLAV
jgi:hypothetical protein